MLFIKLLLLKFSISLKSLVKITMNILKLFKKIYLNFYLFRFLHFAQICFAYSSIDIPKCLFLWSWLSLTPSATPINLCIFLLLTQQIYILFPNKQKINYVECQSIKYVICSQPMRVLHFFLAMFLPCICKVSFYPADTQPTQCHSAVLLQMQNLPLPHLTEFVWVPVKPLLQSVKVPKCNNLALLPPDLGLSPGECALGVSSN